MNLHTVHAALCLTGFALGSQGLAAELTLPNDGWAGWQVDAVEGAPAWCCWSSLDNRNSSPQACQLDDDRSSHGSRDKSTTEAVRVYARLAGGKVQRVRVYAASCPVEAATPIRDLGSVDSDDSARLLVTLMKRSGMAEKNHDLHQNLLAALGMHRGDVAHNSLVPLARDDAHAETRKMAIFWLALLRGTAGADVASAAMFNDQDPEVRKHAAFATTQSMSPRIAENLIRLGNTDKDGDVRAQAWFWLAHTGAAKSEEAIIAALRKDIDEHVREQAIFALSRLPAERATRALIAAAEDRSLTNEQRKRAVFWLAQSEAAGAEKYLERVFAGKGTD